MSKRLYIIAGPNGAGKTTASFTILPEILGCEEFVNADEIARGLSPFNPNSANFQAGRLMLEKIKANIKNRNSFAFETTLATKSYRNYITQAKGNGYFVSLLFFWLKSDELAVKRVATRVSEGGHDIPENIILRRYRNGLKNFFSIYSKLVDSWIFIDNSGFPYELIAERKNPQSAINIHNSKVWGNLNKDFYESK